MQHMDRVRKPKKTPLPAVSGHGLVWAEYEWGPYNPISPPVCLCPLILLTLIIGPSTAWIPLVIF